MTKTKTKKKSTAMKSKSLWDWVKETTEIQNPNIFKELDEADIKSFDTFMIQRTLGRHRDLCQLINYLQKYNLSIPYTKEEYYRILIDFVPQKKYWTKYNKKVKDQYPTWFKKLISDYYKVSLKEVNDYLQIIDMQHQNTKEQFLIGILEAYGTDPKKYKEVGIKISKRSKTT